MDYFKSTLLAAVCLLTFSPWQSAFSQVDSFQQETKTIFKAFQTKNYELIKPLLDAKVRTGNLPTGFNDMVIPQILNQLPEPSSYKVTEIQSTDSGIWVKTEYSYKMGIERPQSFLFNKDRKVIDFDVLSGTQTMAAQATMPQGDTKLIHFEAPFKVKQGIILMKAKLNGVERDFIFDSGSPTLIFNSEILDSGSVVKSQAAALGVGGTASLGVSKIQSFDWNGMELKDFDGICMELGHLKKALGQEFAGLIGYTLFSQYQVTFDYAAEKVYFDLTDEHGNLKDSSLWINPGKTGLTIAFEQFQHIPMIPVDIDGQTYKMGLDCGASNNVLLDKYFDPLKKSKVLKKKKTREAQGAGAEQSKMRTGNLKGMSVDGLAYPKMIFAFDNSTISQINAGYGADLDGLLGYPFFKEFVTVINYQKKEIFIYQ